MIELLERVIRANPKISAALVSLITAIFAVVLEMLISAISVTGDAVSGVASSF